MAINTPKFRASYPNLFKSKKNDLNGKDEYSVVALFPKGTDLSALKKVCEEAIKAKWGNEPKKWPPNLKTPFRNQSEKAKTDEVTGQTFLPPGHEEGGIFINLKSAQKPQIVKRNPNGDLEDIIDTSEIYAGCYLVASVNAFAYDQKGNKGVSLGLNNIMKVGDGDQISGKANAMSDFSSVAVDSDASALFK
jgi:hypothetical protein